MRFDIFILFLKCIVVPSNSLFNAENFIVAKLYFCVHVLPFLQVDSIRRYLQYRGHCVIRFRSGKTRKIYSVSQKKSSASAACSNLSTVTPVCTQQCVKRHCREFLCLHYNQIEIFSSKITQIGMHEYRQPSANTCAKILCYDF